MTRTYEIPGAPSLRLEHLLLDVNGTLTNRAALLDGVAERLRRVTEHLWVTLLSADTFGTLDELGRELGLEAVQVNRGEEKSALVEERGATCCAAIGNGANDQPMLAVAVLGIAVIGPEGASAAALRSADVVCGSINDALDLLLDERAMASTLRP